MEREVGGGIGMGNTCKSMADSCQCMTKTTTIKKIKTDIKKNKEHPCTCVLHIFETQIVITFTGRFACRGPHSM